MRLLTLLFVVLVGFSFAAPEAVAQQAEPVEEPVRATDRALLFSLSGINLLNSDIGSFRGGIGMRWWTSENRALVLGTRVGLQGEEMESEIVGSSFPGTERRNTGTQQLDVYLGMEWHTDATQRLTPFYGVFGGVGLIRQRNRLTRTFEDTDDIDLDVDQTTGGTNFSVFTGANLGAEYQLTRDLAISVQQGVQLRVYRELQLTPEDRQDDTRRGFMFGTLGGPVLRIAVSF